MTADEFVVKRHVRQIILDVSKPLTVNGDPITSADQVDPAWTLGVPFPIGMDKTKINTVLVPRLDSYLKSLKPTASFKPSDIKPTTTVGDVQDIVWGKVE